MASFLALGASSYLSIDSRPEIARSPTGAPPPVALSSALPVPAPRAVDSVDDLVGAYLLAREGDEIVRLQIQEFAWGITSEGNIGLALLRALKEDGQLVDYHRPELYQRLAYSPAELRNTYFRYKDGSRVAVDEISYRIDESGVLAISQWMGRDRDGSSFLYDDLAAQLTFLDDPVPVPGQSRCCRQVTITECLTNNGCTAGCAGPSSCACTTPAGSTCYLQTGPQCVGECGGTCNHVGACSGTPPACSCH